MCIANTICLRVVRFSYIKYIVSPTGYHTFSHKFTFTYFLSSKITMLFENKIFIIFIIHDYFIGNILLSFHYFIHKILNNVQYCISFTLNWYIYGKKFPYLIWNLFNLFRCRSKYGSKIDELNGSELKLDLLQEELAPVTEIMDLKLLFLFLSMLIEWLLEVNTSKSRNLSRDEINCWDLY